HLVQLWVALPRAEEETEPEFHHHPSATLPELEVSGARLRLLAGNAYGKSSPVRIFSPLFYLEAVLPAGCTLPLPEEHEERGVYLLSGQLSASSALIEERSLTIFPSGSSQAVHANVDSRLLLLGGAPPDGPRYIEWNFISSSQERIERAKAAWQAGQFPKVPGDDQEFIPLPAPKPAARG
ncbi:MAG TPA: pirin-like C-terminal cupin domain-containing protein, partial [Polyangiaceae bacterium]|nr:pirin-like C-terminal cupin domain-containing protein [Polyangiaceae bacterium]